MSLLNPLSDRNESAAERRSGAERSSGAERPSTSDVGRSPTTGDSPSTSAGGQSLTDGALFRLGRVLFGAVLSFMAVDNFRTLDETVEYAEAGGAPMPETTVPAVSSSLLVGSVGVALWRAPVLAASAVATFFVTVTPVMHDFWAIDDPEQKQQQQIHFLKNAALLGASLVFLALGLREE